MFLPSEKHLEQNISSFFFYNYITTAMLCHPLSMDTMPVTGEAEIGYNEEKIKRGGDFEFHQ